MKAEKIVLTNHCLCLFQRGYQLHILLFTVNSIVSALINATSGPGKTDSLSKEVQEESGETSNQTQTLLFDTSMDKILTMIESELFGNLLEEKKIAALVKATAEAKKIISYGLLERLGAHISKSMVVDVVNHLIRFGLSIIFFRKNPFDQNLKYFFRAFKK